MKNRSLSLGLCAFAAVAGTVCTAQAGAVVADLLIVDLSTPNQVTITGTAGLSIATRSGSANVGVYMAGYFSVSGFDFAEFSNPGSTLTSVGSPVSGFPGIYRFSSGDAGLNVYDWTGGTATFTAGTQAFTGSATWNVSPALYADLLGGNTSGLLYFPADDAGDLAGATVIGTWRMVPTPGAAALLGLGGLAITRRRRA